MEKFNTPPGWPEPPKGWAPKPGWKPEPSWTKAPEGWHFWVNEWGEPVPGPAGVYGSKDVDATLTAAIPTSTTAIPTKKQGVIADALQNSRERGAERAAAEARSTLPGDDDDSARRAVKWVAGAIVASVIFLALMAAFFHRSTRPTPAHPTKPAVTTPAVSTPTRRHTVNVVPAPSRAITAPTSAPTTTPLTSAPEVTHSTAEPPNSTEAPTTSPATEETPVTSSTPQITSAPTTTGQQVPSAVTSEPSAVITATPATTEK